MKRHRLLLPFFCLLLASWALPVSAGPREQLEGVTIKPPLRNSAINLSSYLKTVEQQARKALGDAAPNIRLELPSAKPFMNAMFGGPMPGGQNIQELPGLFMVNIPEKECNAWQALEAAAAKYDLDVVVRGKSVLVLDLAEEKLVRSYPCSPELNRSISKLQLVQTYTGSGNAMLDGFLPMMIKEMVMTYDQGSETLIVTAKAEILALFELSFLALQRAENPATTDGKAKPGQAILHTRKGSTLAGTLKAERLNLKTPLGQLDVPLGRLKTIWFDAEGKVICHLANGDRIQAELTLDALSMDTELGTMEIPVVACRVLRLGTPFVPQGNNMKVLKELQKSFGQMGLGGDVFGGPFVAPPGAVPEGGFAPEMFEAPLPEQP